MKTKKVKITIRKDEKGTFLYLKTPVEIEQFFAKLSGGEKQTSQKWLDENGNGHNFYKLTEEINQKINGYSSSYIFNDFGDGLIKNRDYVNIAPLRAENVSNGIKIYDNGKDIISNSEIENYLRRLSEFIKQLWIDHISKKSIKAIISLEV